MANASIKAAFERMWQHTTSAVNDVGQRIPKLDDELKVLGAAADAAAVGEALDYIAGIKADKTDIPTKTSQLTNDSGYLISAPVTSVNGKAGDVVLTANEVGADASGTAKSVVSLHDTSADAHSDIREQISQLSTELHTKKGVLYSEQLLTDEQKSQARANIGAVTQADIDAAVSNVMPEFVDSVDQMTDKAKKYVLTTTGTVWVWEESEYEQEIAITETITGHEQGRLGSDGSNAGDSLTTHTVTPYIDIAKSEYVGKTIQLHLEGNRYVSESAESNIYFMFFDANKAKLANRSNSCLNKTYSMLPVLTNVSTVINDTTSATITITIPAKYNGNEITYFRFSGLGQPETANVYITYNNTEVISTKQWKDTGVAFSAGGSGDSSQSPDIDVTEIAERAAALVDTNLLLAIGTGEVSV